MMSKVLRSILFSILLVNLSACGGGSDSSVPDINDLGTPTDSSGVLDFPTATIIVDGSNADWSGVDKVYVDPQGDQNGNSSTDLISFSVVLDGTQMVLLMVTDGQIVMPHTPSQDYSHYSVAIFSYSDNNCSTEIGFSIANNITNSAGTNSHYLDLYPRGQTPTVDSIDTVTAHQTNYLETSLNTADIFSGTKSIRFNPFISGYSSSAYIEHDYEVGVDKCYRFTI